MSAIEERVRCRELHSIVMDPVDVVRHIVPRKGTVAWSGMAQMSTPKVLPVTLAKYVEESGEKFKLNIYTVGSAAPELDGSLAKVDAVSRRYTYQNNPVIRKKIDAGEVQYYDLALGEFNYALRAGFLEDTCGPIDLAVVEAVSIREDGSIVPSLSVDIMPTIVKLARRIVVEINMTKPMDIEGIHDVYFGKMPPESEPISLTRVDQRIGVPYIECKPEKIAAIVESKMTEREVYYGKPTDTDVKIVENLMEFLHSELEKGRLSRKLLPIQTGIGPIGDTIASLLEESEFESLEVWTEVAQCRYIEMIDSGKLSCMSGAVLYIPPWEENLMRKFVDGISEYKQKIVLRPIEVTNNHEVIRRLGVIAMNQAIEVDIYGFVNATHVLGSRVVNGVGGSPEFARASHLAIYLLSSTTRGGKISRIVPMVTHVDIPDHDVDVIVTEHGYADLRGKSPRERAREIIEKCAHPDYRDELLKYFEKACMEVGGHMPHILSEAFSWHIRYMEKGSMLP